MIVGSKNSPIPTMKKPVKIIDLFSGPGGLGEGFSACKNKDGSPTFKIAVSIEKEKSAHATLLLRAFYRLLDDEQKATYFDFMKGNLGDKPSEKLYGMFPDQHEAAKKEALCLELGKDNTKINKAIRDAIEDEECILIGGPPCQAYSLAGQARNKSNSTYKAEDDQRNFLYKEYLKVIARFQPMIFVMENVKGMLSAKINGHPIFDSIYNDLQDPCKACKTQVEQGRENHKYKILSLVTPNGSLGNEERDPREFIVRSENYEVPQKRHRVILLGVREDLAHRWDDSMLLSESSKIITVKDVVDGLSELRSGLSKVKNHTEDDWLEAICSISKVIIPSLKKSKNKRHRSVAIEIMRIIKDIKAPKNSQGSLFKQKAKTVKTISPEFNSWLNETRLDGYITNHETRGHIEKDLNRYLFCSAWAICAKNEGWDVHTPKSSDYIEELAPNHANFKSGKFADRFRVQASYIPATTITSHISKDGHYFIHPDPLQCRSLTVREAARIQTFPDSYFFVGNRTEQYVQVGNAVPPFLAAQLAKIVENLINR